MLASRKFATVNRFLNITTIASGGSLGWVSYVSGPLAFLGFFLFSNYRNSDTSN